MNMNDELVNGILVLTLCDKRLDASAALDFKQKVAKFIDQGHKILLLDMSLVDFIDSSGLGAIVSCLKLIGIRGSIGLCNVAPPILGLFQMTRMDKVFPIYPSREAALAELQGSSAR